jgi:iron-sulfur cluster assembly accessory protein
LYDVITITDAASAKVKELLESEGKSEHALRVFVRGMSCSGPAFGMALDDQTRADDTIAEQFGIKIVVDPQSAEHVEGAQIDWVDSLMGKGFTINSPSASSGGGGCGGGCACGK